MKKQKENYKGFFLTHKYVASLVDDIRTRQLNNFYFHKKKHSLKILHITNFNERLDGRLFFNTGRRINNGFIRAQEKILIKGGGHKMAGGFSINISNIENKIKT